MWRKNWMHGDVEQEGLYQNCVFHYRWGRGFAPRVGQNIWTFLSSFQLLLWNCCTNFNQFWHKASIGNSEFHNPCPPPPPPALRAGQKLLKFDQFSKIFFSTTAHVEEKLNAWWCRAGRPLPKFCFSLSLG
jgi:hypothetical protein